MLKGTKLYSVVRNRCPKCQEGAFFKTDNPYNFKLFDKQNDNCSVCGEDFKKEPGFYYGSMYVSYALTVAYAIGLTVIFVLGFEFELKKVFFFLFPSMIVLLPFFFRFARLMWLNFFVHYRGNQTKNS